MKHFLALLACCLVLQAPARAVELSLAGTSPLGAGLPASTVDGSNLPTGKSLEVDATTFAPNHVGDEPRNEFPQDGLGVVPTSSGIGTSATTPDWLKQGGSQSLTLDGPVRTETTGMLDTASPTAVSANIGVSDSMMYALLALLAGAMVWACSGFVSRKQGAPVSAAWGESHRAPRQVRVKMMPLNVSR